MNAFEQYAKQAYRIVNSPAKLIGPTKTRANARLRYAEIVAELEVCTEHDMLDAYLDSIANEIAQFRSELEFYWEGEGDFPGLRLEIERARERCDGAGQSGF